uniref:Deoxyribokinase n=2 Tax=Virgibacillus oceani TaxID=1479511 RepID=A0A917M2E6_9BACI|nr:ribokinase [Virgibacillus oceani]
MDLVVQTPRAPENGETIIGTHFSRFPGGKGANQAVSASRLGGDVIMAGKVGSDEFGEEMIAALNKEQIDTRSILKDETSPTGIGMVTVEADGNNRIIVVPGANMAYGMDDLRTIESQIKAADIVVVQLEMDVHMIERAVTIAADHHVPVILNPAPAQELNDNLLSKVTYLTPNSTEAEILTGIKINSTEDAERAANALLNKGIENVVLTLAEEGALIVNGTGAHPIPGFQVEAVDSVAAGDAFNGALAVGITQGKPLTEVVRFANAVGALTVTKEGAIPSLPNLGEVNNFLNQKLEA